MTLLAAVVVAVLPETRRTLPEFIGAGRCGVLVSNARSSLRWRSRISLRNCSVDLFAESIKSDVLRWTDLAARDAAAGM